MTQKLDSAKKFFEGSGFEHTASLKVESWYSWEGRGKLLMSKVFLRAFFSM